MALKKLSKTPSVKSNTPEVPAAVSFSKIDKAAERKKQNEQRFVKGSSVKIGAKLKQLPLSEINQDPNNARTEYISIGLRRQLSKLFVDKWISDPASMGLTPDELASLAQRALNNASSSVGYNEILETIGQLWELSIHLKSNELMQPFAVRGDSRGGYIVAFGNRRFLALCIAHGEEHSVECLSYETPPASPNLKRFVENIQRTDLPLRAKLKDFLAARSEVADSAASETEAAITLGLPRTTYYALKSIAKCEPVVTQINRGVINHITFAEHLAKYIGKNPDFSEKIVKVIESWEGPLPSWSDFLPVLKKSLVQAPKKSGRGRPAKITVPAISSPVTLQKILAPEVLARADWKAIDWEDGGKENIARVQKLLRLLIEEVAKQ